MPLSTLGLVLVPLCCANHSPCKNNWYTKVETIDHTVVGSLALGTDGGMSEDDDKTVKSGVSYQLLGPC